MDDLEDKKYAIEYLDNGGVLHNIPQKDSHIRTAIENELKREYMVFIGHKMKQFNSYSQKILTKINKKESDLENPEQLYLYLGKLSLKELDNLKKIPST